MAFAANTILQNFLWKNFEKHFEKHFQKYFWKLSTLL